MAEGSARLLYDRDCGFCRWSVAAVLKRDWAKRLRPVGIETDEGAELLSGMAASHRLASWHLVTEGGELFSGGDALGPLLERLDRPVLARLAGAFPAPTRLGYGLVARSRRTLGRLVGQAARRRADAIVAARSDVQTAPSISQHRR